jgi:hypothetical protein
MAAGGIAGAASGAAGLPINRNWANISTFCQNFGGSLGISTACS